MSDCTHGDWTQVSELVQGTAGDGRKYRVCRKCWLIQELSSASPSARPEEHHG